MDERWERVKDLLHQALQLSDDQRGSFLSEVGRSDDPLRRELESLLAADAEARSSFLRSDAGLWGLHRPDGIDSVPSLATGQIFEQRFRLVSSLGEGGMGQVWLAEQFMPVRREVAIKLIRAGMYDDSVVQRFRTERQSLAIMNHPCIAKVFEAGATAQGQPYLVMEYVKGPPITEYCDSRRLNIRRRLALFILACEGVQHAHQKAILHRDLKPANILVVEVDGVPTPRIIDFGLAKDIQRLPNERSLQTQYGQFLGTPGYMSPEQADPGSGADIDTRADVYSLGVILYVLLTGLRPFERSRASPPRFDEWLRQLRTEDPPRLTAVLNRESVAAAAEVRSTSLKPLLRNLRGDLEWIAAKAVCRERDGRYGSPFQLVEDLQRYLNHEPVSARPASATYQLLRFVQRHRVAAAAIALVSVSAMVALIAGVLAVQRQREADVQRREAQSQTRQALQSQGYLLTEVAAERLAGGDVAGAQRIVIDVLTNPVLREARSPAAISVFQESRAADRQLAVLSGHTARVYSARYSPDGTRIVTASSDRSARVWDAATGVQVLTLTGHTDRVLDAAYSPDGVLIVTGSNDGTARLWDARTGAPLRTFSGHAGRVSSARFSPDGRQLVTASYDHSVRIWDTTSGGLVAQLIGHSGEVYTAAYCHDGSRLVTASQDKTARIWNVRTGAQITLLKGHGDYVTSAEFSPDCQRIVTTSADKTARIWEAGSGAALAVLSGHGEVVYSADFSPDGRSIVTASWDRTARLWDVSSGRQLALLSGHQSTLASAAYSPDGTHIVTASQDRTARIWDVRPSAPLVTVIAADDIVNSAAYSPDGNRIVTSSDDNTARIWDALTGSLLLTLSGHGGAVDAAVFSHDGRYILTASQDKTARIWDADSGAQVRALSDHTDRIYSAAFSPDDAQALTASRDKSARALFWDAHSSASPAKLLAHSDRVYSAAWSHDGLRIVTASRDRTARVWDALNAHALLTLRGHEGQLLSAAYSPDDARIVTASSDGTARVWDSHSGAQLRVLSGHGAAVTVAQYSPDGARIVTASEDRTARLWDAQSGEQLAVFAGHDAAVTSVAYAPDGMRIVTSSADHTMRVWSAVVPAGLTTQILWAAAAELDSESSEPTQSLLPLDPRVRSQDPGSSACDRSAAAPYDPDRMAAGVPLQDIDIDAADGACATELKLKSHPPRVDYEMGRVWLAQHKFTEAQRGLEIAVAAGYRAAQVDLAMVLLRTRSNESRARSLYEKAFRDGVSVAAFELGQLSEQDAHNVERGRIVGEAASWYQRGADADEPNSLARLAEQQEYDAVLVSDPIARNQQLLHAFDLYALAAERARLEAWPESISRHWRYRRASLARALASDGLMVQVAQSFRRVIAVGSAH